MTTDRETTVLVRSWIAEGVDRLPDRVLDAVLDQVPATPQRRPLRPAWTTNPFPTTIKILAPMAAVILVAVVGFNLLPLTGGIVAPTPSPSPTATPSPTPAPTPAPGPSEIPIGGGDTIEFQAGTYRIPEPFIAPLSLTFASPWTSGGLDPDGVFFYRSSPAAFAPTLLIDRAYRVFPDPCRPEPESALQSPPAELPTGDEIVAALQNLEGFTAGPVTDVTVGAHPARTFVLTNAITDAAAAECTGSPLDMWESRFGRNVTNQRGQDHIWVVDLNGSPITIDAQTFPGVTQASQVAEVEALVASIQFDQ